MNIPHEQNIAKPVTKKGQSLCLCGSGLRALRCCALDVSAQAEPAHYALLMPLMGEVEKARHDGRARDAARQLLTMLDLAPLWPQALHALFEIRLAEGKKSAAEALAARLVGVRPEEAEALGSYAGILAAQEKYKAAIEVAGRGLLLTPPLPVFHHILGISYTELGQWQEGEWHYRQALAQQPAEAKKLIGQLKNNLAWNLYQQGRLDEAAALYVALCAAEKVNPQFLTNWVQVEAGRGQWDQAATLLETARTRVPDDRLAALLGALLALRGDDPEAALKQVEERQERLKTEKPTVTESVVRGQALERLGRYQPAWAAYQTGRAAQAQHMRRSDDQKPAQARLEAVLTSFRADHLAALPRPKQTKNHPAPIFLLGTPGSGTSLLEHLLSQSARIDPADQHAPLPALAHLLPGLVRGLGGPDLPFAQALCATACGALKEVPQMLAARYHHTLKAAGVTGAQTRFVTDRHAELPWLLGLAVFLFPQAPVIHLLRHPLDVVLSIYATDKVYEGGAGLTLLSAAQLYDVQMQAIAHVRGQMTMRYLPLRYEELVTDPALTLCRVHDFIGLSGEDPQALVTALPRKVPRVPVYRTWLEPVHQRGLGRHKKFGAAFNEVLPLLTPWIERLGYGRAQAAG